MGSGARCAIAGRFIFLREKRELVYVPAAFTSSDGAFIYFHGYVVIRKTTGELIDEQLFATLQFQFGLIHLQYLGHGDLLMSIARGFAQ